MNTKNLWKSQGMKLCAYYLDNCRIAEEEWVNKEWIKDHLRILKHDYDVRYINKFLGLLELEIWYSNDETKIPVQIKLEAKIGMITLKLKKIISQKPS